MGWRKIFGCLAFAALAFSLYPSGVRAEDSTAARPVGLFTTMPIYWGEAEELAELLRPEAASHWVRRTLEERHGIVFPLDVLDPEAEELAELQYLLMAQPRALAPAENVAVDDWVRDGGHLLMFVDPWLEEPSRFALGDPRRSYPAALVSPILARWGLRLEFDDQQGEGIRQVPVNGQSVSVEMAGRLSAIGQPAPASADCAIQAEGLIAQCRIGGGSALVVADAALLRADMEQPAASQSLKALLDQAFPLGDSRGKARGIAPAVEVFAESQVKIDKIP